MLSGLFILAGSIWIHWVQVVPTPIASILLSVSSSWPLSGCSKNEQVFWRYSGQEPTWPYLLQQPHIDALQNWNVYTHNHTPQMWSSNSMLVESPQFSEKIQGCNKGNKRENWPIVQKQQIPPLTFLAKFLLQLFAILLIATNITC